MCDHCGCRSYPPIAELTADHEEILRLAWTLAEAAHHGTTPDPSTRRELVELLGMHVVKEETGLYPVLLSTAGASGEEIAGLEEEHRELGRRLADAVFDRRDYYALAAHIEVEEMELFPAAMFGFDDEEWEATSDAHRAAGRTVEPAG